jgi:hypothetical protein
MIRVILINLLLFSAPFLATWAWMRFIATHQPDALRRRYYAIAALAGLVLVLASLMTYRASTGNAPSGTYVPPSYHDGVITPGRFE